MFDSNKKGIEIPLEQIPYQMPETKKEWNDGKPQRKNKYGEKAFPYNDAWIKEWQKQEGMVRFRQEIVEGNPKGFVAEEEIPASKILWEKNIYTRMSGLPYEDGYSWIEIYFQQLSSENKEIAQRIGDNQSRGRDRCLIQTEHVGSNGQRELLNLAKEFKMQDVPCSCESSIDILQKTLVCNGAYVTLERFLELVNNHSKRAIVAEDIAQIAKEYGAIYEEETKRIYCSQFDYDKHQKYMEYLKSTKANTDEARKKKFLENIKIEDPELIEKAQKKVVSDLLEKNTSKDSKNMDR